MNKKIIYEYINFSRTFKNKNLFMEQKPLYGTKTSLWLHNTFKVDELK